MIAQYNSDDFSFAVARISSEPDEQNASTRLPAPEYQLAEILISGNKKRVEATGLAQDRIIGNARFHFGDIKNVISIPDAVFPR